jgi:tetratricopeptide (TPR) repeat protein
MLKRADAIQPDQYRLHAIRGEILALENRPDEAVREYQTALAHMPESVPEGVLYPISLHVDLYQLYRDTNDTAGANREATTARNLVQQINIQDPSRPEFLRLRAAVEMAFNDSQSAERDLKEALALAPTNTNIILNYGNLLWKTDRRPEAVDMYNRALKVEPANAAAISSLSWRNSTRTITWLIWHWAICTRNGAISNMLSRAMTRLTNSHPRIRWS